MANIKIIVDSASDLPKELAQKYNITVLPLGIVIDDKIYYDGVDFSNREYMQQLKEMKNIPTTTMVPITMMEEEFRKNLDTYEHQIFITISSNASGTFSAANLIKTQIEDELKKPSNITVIDSLAFSMIYGKIAINMAKMAEKDATYDEIIKAYNIERESSTAYFVVDDLMHLKRGGRIKPGIAIVGELLGIKPLLTIKDGLVDSIGKERGKKRAMEKILDMMILELETPQDTTLWVANGYADEDVDTIISMIKGKVKLKDIIPYDMGACIGTHAGAGLVGLIYSKRENI